MRVVTAAAVSEDERRVEAEGPGERVLGDPEIAESQLFSALRHAAHGVHLDRIGRATRQAHADRDAVFEGHGLLV